MNVNTFINIRKQTLKDDCFVLKYYYVTYRTIIIFTEYTSNEFN